jgi:hypothetical protein
MKDDGSAGATRLPEELSEERSEFSHRLASFGLGEKPGRLFEERRRPARTPEESAE